MKKTTIHSILRSLIAGFAIYCVAYTVQGQMTTIELPTNDNTSGFEVKKNNGTSVLKVDGDGRITGDGSGLSNVKPVANYTGGSSSIALTPVVQVVKSVALTVPSSGTVIVNASGFARWSSIDDDVYRLCLSSTPNLNNLEWMHNTIGTDYACPDSSDQYAPVSLTRGFTVSSAGTYTYYLYGDNPTWASGFGNSIVYIQHVHMTAMYFPTSGTGKEAIREEQQVPPGTGLEGPRM